jgi:hypothetical protein
MSRPSQVKAIGQYWRTGWIALERSMRFNCPPALIGQETMPLRQLQPTPIRIGAVLPIRRNDGGSVHRATSPLPSPCSNG